jgi:CrcB protein
MGRFLWIMAAGAAGTAVRYQVGLWAGKALGTAFPWGTLLVNVAGCFLIAAISHVALATSLVSPTLRLALTTGFMGGLTTYSSFNYETTRYVEQGAWLTAVVNAGGTLAGCFASGLLGLALARRLVGP